MSRTIESNPGVPQPLQDEAQRSAEEKLTAFFEQNRDFFVLYAGDASIKVRPSRTMGTFAIDLEKGELLGDPSYYEKKGMTEAHAFNSFLHEFEHFRRLMGLVRERGGLAQWKAHRERILKRRHLHVFDNVLEDISVDRAILTRAPNQTETQFDLYRNHLWKRRDMTSLPKHLQFIYALFREQMMSEEPVEVAEDVRAEIQTLRDMKNHSGQNVIDVMSHPDLPQAKRLALQERFFESVYERLFQEDVQKKREEHAAKQEQEEQEGEESPEQGQPSQGEPQEGNGEGEPQPAEPQEGDEGVEPQEGEPDEGSAQDGEPTPGEPQEGSPQSGEPQPGEPQSGDEPSAPSQPGLPEDPDDIFGDLYKEYLENSPDAAISDEQIDEAVNAVLGKGGKPKTPEELAQEAYAREAGVSVEDLRAYQDFWQTVEELRSPDADETVVEQIRAVFRAIITERLAPVRRPKQPVDEGEYLIRPAEAVAETRAGHTDPAVWMTHEVHEHPKELVGALDVTIVCDRSISMKDSDGTSVKMTEQQKAAALTLEALREFCDDLDEERADLLEDLHVRSEVWGFGGPPEVECLKALSEELTDRERVAVWKALANVPGNSTRDDLVLEAILASIPEEDFERIARGELRKVVLVLTDGDSSNAEGAKVAIKALRNRGVVVVAIGITKAAKKALKLYKPDGRLAKTAADTGIAVGKVLQEHIRELNGS